MYHASYDLLRMCANVLWIISQCIAYLYRNPHPPRSLNISINSQRLKRCESRPWWLIPSNKIEIHFDNYQR